MKKRAYTETEQLADSILARIREELDTITIISETATKEMEALAARHNENLTPHQFRFDSLKLELTTLMKGEKAVFFKDADVVNLLNGSLIHGEKKELRIPKKAVALAEAEGLLDAIKTVKSIDRGVVEKWTDEKLARIRATRKTKETYSYELKS